METTKKARTWPALAVQGAGVLVALGGLLLLAGAGWTLLAAGLVAVAGGTAKEAGWL